LVQSAARLIYSVNTKHSFDNYRYFCGIGGCGLFFKQEKMFYKPLFQRLLTFFVCTAIVFALLDFFAEEYVPFLSARFWFILWVIGMIVGLGSLLLMPRNFPPKKSSWLAIRSIKNICPKLVG